MNASETTLEQYQQFEVASSGVEAVAGSLACSLSVSLSSLSSHRTGDPVPRGWNPGAVLGKYVLGVSTTPLKGVGKRR
jgi:hypothetical protein